MLIRFYHFFLLYLFFNNFLLFIIFLNFKFYLLNYKTKNKIKDNAEKCYNDQVTKEFPEVYGLTKDST